MYCLNADGEPVQIADDVIEFAPAAYGILIETGRVLLTSHPVTGLLSPPGLRLQQGQSPRAALRTHFRTLIGLTPEIGQLFFTEEQHRLDEAGNAWHLTLLYYSLRRPPGQIATLNDVEMQWLALGDLSPDMMQFGFAAIRAVEPWA